MAEGRQPRLGITAMPEWIQVEGVEPLLDNLQGLAGASTVITSPYVMEPVAEGTGGREPPIDAGAGSVRLLDRLLWGRREIACRTAPSFAPEKALYAGLRYRPAEPDALTQAEGGKLGKFLRAAKRRGLEVQLQVQAAIPPGYRVQFGGPEAEDEPRLPDGGIPQPRVDRNGSLASPHIRAYTCALLRDLAQNYPEADAVRVDWPEYPPYTFDSWFTDHSAHAQAAARRLGYDPERMQYDAGRLRQLLLGGIEPGVLRELAHEPGYAAARLLARFPGFADMLRLKADLVVETLAAYRAALPNRMALIAHAFPPPWSALCGMDYARVGREVQGIAVKLYTMHWPMMLRQYGEAMLAGQPGLDAGALARALVAAFATGGPVPQRLDELRYPEPEEPHPAGGAAMAAKVRLTRAEAGPCPVTAGAHGYGPLDDFERRFRAVWATGGPGVWVNRYGYLSDAKLAVLGRVVRERG